VSPEVGAVREALTRFKEAYETLSIDEVQKMWPSMSKAQKSGLKDTFNRAKALHLQYEGCNEPIVAGDTAKISCTQIMTLNWDGKLQAPQSNPVIISFKKTGNGWLVDDLRGR